MHVVVTGATGNVGTSLIEALSVDPAVDSVLGIARRPTSWAPPKVTFVAADVRTAPLDELFRGADAVVHASSVGAYRAARGHRPVDETWPTDALPTASYGREKSYLERVLDRIACQHPVLRVVRMRPCFLFKRASATSQRRIFAGALLAPPLLRAVPPVLPLPGSLQFQVMHTSDAAEAYRRVLHEPVHGAVNVAAEPPIGPHELAAVLGARAVPVPMALVRNAVAAAWHARVLPASPHLVDLVAGLPLLDSTRARTELGWAPVRTGPEALAELVDGLRIGSDFPTPPLGDEPSVAAAPVQLRTPQSGAVPSPAAPR